MHDLAGILGRRAADGIGQSALPNCRGAIVPVTAFGAWAGGKLLRALEALRTELEASVAETKQACEDLEIRLQGTVSSLESEKGETTRLKGEVKKTQQQSDAQKTELEATIAGLRGDLAASQQDGKMLEAELQSLKEAQGETEKEIQERISSFTREAESCRMQVAAKEVEIEGVQKVVEEKLGKIADLETQLMDAEQLRRKLHNQIQELKGNIRVFCRVKGGSAPTEMGVRCPPTIDSSVIELLSRDASGKRPDSGGMMRYQFDRVFDEATSQGSSSSSLSERLLSGGERSSKQSQPDPEEEDIDMRNVAFEGAADIIQIEDLVYNLQRRLVFAKQDVSSFTSKTSTLQKELVI